MITPYDDEFAGAAWTTSSYSGDNNECVEVAYAGERVGVRDSKRPSGPALVLPVASWAAAIDALRTDAL